MAYMHSRYVQLASFWLRDREFMGNNIEEAVMLRLTQPIESTSPL
jgi:hypothetical protein